MQIAVLGIGKTGQAMAAYLLSLGHAVTLWGRNKEKADIVREKGISITGLLTGHYKPQVADSLESAVAKADYIFVMTVAAGHRPLAERLAGNLAAGQRIVVFNGNWGAIEFDFILREEMRQKNVLLAETGGMILLADSPEPGASHLRKIKNSMSIAGIPKTAAAVVADELKGIFPGLEPAGNVLETSINNANPILHSVISLFNFSRIENGEDYRFYAQAASETILSFVEEADKERLEVASAIGIQGQSCLSILNSFWTDQHDNLYDVIKKNDNYMRSKGPVSLEYRYITEDIPYGIVPIVKLGKKYGVKIPHLESVLQCYSLLMQRDYLALGPDVSSLEPSSYL